MKSIEKLLCRAKQGEYIVIDRDFEKNLKDRIQQPTQPAGIPLYLKRLFIPLVPVTITVFLFFIYMQDVTINPSPTPTVQYKEVARIMDNRSTPPEYGTLPSSLENDNTERIAKDVPSTLLAPVAGSTTQELQQPTTPTTKEPLVFYQYLGLFVLLLLLGAFAFFLFIPQKKKVSRQKD